MNIVTNKDVLERFILDESNAFVADINLLDKVFFPQNTNDVKNSLMYCIKTNSKLTVSGAGTSITGARVPVCGGIVLSTEKILSVQSNCSLIVKSHNTNYKIIKKETPQGIVQIFIDEELKTAVVPCGISLETLNNILPKNLFFPPDPTESSAYIGGLIATNASGARSYKYGATRNWILGLELILPDAQSLTIQRGEIILDSNRNLKFSSNNKKNYSILLPKNKMLNIKNVAGIYFKSKMDLVDLFIGSEGIFGITVYARISLLEKPKMFYGVLTFFKNDTDCLSYANDLRNDKEKRVVSVEYFDRNSLQFLREKYQNIKESYSAAIFTEIADANDYDLTWLSTLSGKNNSVDDWFADNTKNTMMLKDFRHALPESINSYIKRNKSLKLGTDFVVPINKLDKIMKVYKEAGKSFTKKFPRDGFHYVLFGHLGDSHLHFNFLIKNESEKEYAKQLYLEMAKEAVILNGTISGEHGVGKKKIFINNKEVEYLNIMYNPEYINDIIKIKKYLDRSNILNAGNIVEVK